MGEVEKLEHDVQRLDHVQLAAFREWFQKYDSAEWDRQIEKDVLAGCLDKLAEKSRKEHKAGRTKKL